MDIYRWYWCIICDESEEGGLVSGSRMTGCELCTWLLCRYTLQFWRKHHLLLFFFIPSTFPAFFMLSFFHFLVISFIWSTCIFHRHIYPLWCLSFLPALPSRVISLLLEVAPFNTDGNAVPLLTTSLGFCPKPSLFHLHFFRKLWLGK